MIFIMHLLAFALFNISNGFIDSVLPCDFVVRTCNYLCKVFLLTFDFLDAVLYICGLKVVM